MPRREQGSPTRADEFQRQIEENQDLVELVARIVKRTHPRVSMEDFIGAGQVGLVQAARRFQAGRGACFRTFASRRIRGEMLELVRRRHLREDSNFSLDSIDPKSAAIECIHLDNPGSWSGAGGSPYVADPHSGDAMRQVEAECRVVSILAGLSPQERRALRARFLEDGNMRQVAARLGVSLTEAGRLVRESLEHAREVEERRQAA